MEKTVTNVFSKTSVPKCKFKRCAFLRWAHIWISRTQAGSQPPTSPLRLAFMCSEQLQ